MKKAILIILLASVLLLSACGNAPSQEETDAKETAATKKITEQETEDTENDIDFSSVDITDYVVLAVGESIDMSGCVSDTDIVSVENGKLTAMKKGFSILSEDGKEGVAVCVVPEGTGEDKSAGTPTFVSIGETLALTADIPNPQFFSSDSEVIEVEGNTGYCKGAGYCVITASNASVPRFFAYIVIDK